MNFGRGRSREEPEINLIPMIDVLLVIIIFLMLTTTYSRFAGLEINLPTADAQASNAKTVVLRGNLAKPRNNILNRVIQPPVAMVHFKSGDIVGQSQQLVTKADAKNRFIFF